MQMFFYGLYADSQSDADLVIGFPFHNQVQHIQLAGGQLSAAFLFFQ